MPSYSSGFWIRPGSGCASPAPGARGEIRRQLSKRKHLSIPRCGGRNRTGGWFQSIRARLRLNAEAVSGSGGSGLGFSYDSGNVGRYTHQHFPNQSQHFPSQSEDLHHPIRYQSEASMAHPKHQVDSAVHLNLKMVHIHTLNAYIKHSRHTKVRWGTCCIRGGHSWDFVCGWERARVLSFSRPSCPTLAPTLAVERKDRSSAAHRCV